MKRILAFMAMAFAALSMISCEEGNPTMEFDRILYTIYNGSSVDVAINISEPASATVTVPLFISGDAEKGVDYTISSESVTIPAGQTSGKITINAISLTVEKQVGLGFVPPAGYNLGAKAVAVIVPDSDEALVYSFSSSKGTALEGFYTELKVSGAVSGSDVVTSKDITIPLKTLDCLTLADGGDSVVLPAGKTSVGIKFNVPSDLVGEATDVIAVNDLEDARFIPGDNASVKVTVKGLQTPDKLVGTWKFNKIFDQEEVELWFMEMEDDPDLLPTHNEGFTLTFATDASGDVTVTPSGAGDFANFFRTATVTLSAPVNTTASAVTLGSYSVRDQNMFAGEAYSAYQYNTYYKLSSANRAFSSETEKLGEATVIFSLVDEGLYVEFRDYDTPPFGEMWWDGFDPDMFGFASLFTSAN